MLIQIGFVVVVSALGFAGVTCQLKAFSGDDVTIRKSLAMCITSASENNFDAFDIITIALGPQTNSHLLSTTLSLDSLLLPDLFRREQWSILVKQLGSSYPRLTPSYLNFRHSDAYVIQLHMWTELKLYLVYLKQQPSWNPHAKFIIMSTNIFNDDYAIMRRLIRQLWQCDVLHGVMVIPDYRNNTMMSVYTWFPYAGKSCGNKFHKVTLINTCLFGEMGNNNSWFPNKLPNKMNNCSIRVRTLNYPPFIIDPLRLGPWTHSFRILHGLDVQLLNLVAETANIFLDYQIMPQQGWGNVLFPLNTSTGIIGALLRNEADIGIGSMAAKTNRFHWLDYSSPYFQDSVGFCVPHAEERTQIKKYTGMLRMEHWLFILLSILVVAGVICILGKFQKKNEHACYKTYDGSLINILAIILGQAVHIQPISSLVRLCVLLWICFSFHFDAAYQSYLTSSLTRVQYEYQIQNIEGLLESDMDLLYVVEMADYFNDKNISRYSAQNREIISRWKICPDLDECLRRTAYKRDCAIASQRLYTQYARSKYLSKTGQPLLYCLEESLVSFPMVAYMRPGFPLKHRLDYLIKQVNSAGFVKLFEDNLFKGKKIARPIANSSYSENDFLDVQNGNVLTFNHLMPCLLILAIGYVTSAFVYVIEVFCSRHRHETRN